MMGYFFLFLGEPLTYVGWQECWSLSQRPKLRQGITQEGLLLFYIICFISYV